MNTSPTSQPLVAIIMGSQSDWPTMQACSAMLDTLGIAHECRVMSAHRTPDQVFAYAESAAGRGIEVIIGGAGGAAHLPGILAAKTRLPVLGVPIQSKALNGLDSLLSIVQMPSGIPVGTLAIGESGAKNAAVFAAHILAVHHEDIRTALEDFRQQLNAREPIDPKTGKPA